MIIGIDNGVSTGALVALSESGPIIATIPMPCVMHRTRNEVDLDALREWLQTLGDPIDTTYVIEEPNNARNASTAYSMAACFHAIRGYLTARRRNLVRITPQSWQKAMLGKVPKGLTKEYALEAAKSIWPNERFLKTSKSYTPNEGIVDAALIAEYWRRKIKF